MQEHADRNLWNEVDIILAGLAHQSTGKLALQLRSSKLKNLDRCDFPRFKEHGVLERAHWAAASDDHFLSSHFDGPGSLLEPYAAENSYWETVDRAHRCIEADTTIQKLEGPKNQITDTRSLAEKIRRRKMKRRPATRPALS